MEKKSFEKKIKVLYIVLEMELGGLQRIVNLLIQKINKEQFIPYLCCLDRGGLFCDKLSSDLIKRYVLGRKPGPFDFNMFRKLIAVIKKNKIDVIHSHNGCSSYAALAGRIAGVKGIIHTDHGRLVPDKKTAILEDRFASYMMDRFVAVSEELSRYLGSAVKISAAKLTTVINGVDNQIFRPRSTEEKHEIKRRFGFSEDDKIIGTVCRLDPIKNLSFMVSCMDRIIQKVPKAKLAIVGDGPARETLIAQVNSLGLLTSVNFLGPQQQTDCVIPMFDVYACVSLSEGTSMTILEAMSCGIPIVASAVGGNLTLVKESNGFLFPLGDADRFTDAVVALLRDETSNAKMGKRSREIAESKFSLRRMVEDYELLYLKSYEGV